MEKEFANKKKFSVVLFENYYYPFGGNHINHIIETDDFEEAKSAFVHFCSLDFACSHPWRVAILFEDGCRIARGVAIDVFDHEKLEYTGEREGCLAPRSQRGYEACFATLEKATKSPDDFWGYCQDRFEIDLL